MPTFEKCMVIISTQTFALPVDWTADNGAWVFGSGGNGDEASYACFGPIHIPYAGSGGGGGAYTSSLVIGGTAGDTAICTVSVAGDRGYAQSTAFGRTNINLNGSDVLSCSSGASASTSGPCLNGGGVQGEGGNGGNSGGFGNSGFNFQNGGAGGNLWDGQGQNSTDWTDALSATPNVWFDPAGTGLEYDTVSGLFTSVGTPTYGGGGRGGDSGGVPSINGADGFFPGGGGGGGASAGFVSNTAGDGSDGLILLYYNSSAPPTPPLVGGSRRWLAEMGPIRVSAASITPSIEDYFGGHFDDYFQGFF